VTDNATVRLRHDPLKVYYKIQMVEGKPQRVPDGQGGYVHKGPGTLDYILNEVIGKADKQLIRLNETRVKLRQTRLELEDTIAKLKQTIIELKVANNTIDDLKDQISDLNNDIAQAQVEIDTLNQEKDDLNNQIEIHLESIAKLEDKNQELLGNIDQQEKYIQELLERIRRLTMEKEGPTQRITKGRQGTVASVDADFHYIIIDIGPQSPLLPNIELLVQRGDTFVGRVKVRKVRSDENVAIADILPEELQIPIQKGDYVIY
jgi:predicted RNase H-like nuclease (RuvC/YqgF family)